MVFGKTAVGRSVQRMAMMGAVVAAVTGSGLAANASPAGQVPSSRVTGGHSLSISGRAGAIVTHSKSPAAAAACTAKNMLAVVDFKRTSTHPAYSLLMCGPVPHSWVFSATATGGAYELGDNSLNQIWFYQYRGSVLVHKACLRAPYSDSTLRGFETTPTVIVINQYHSRCPS